MYRLEYHNEEMRQWNSMFSSEDLTEVHKFFRTMGIEMLGAGMDVRIIRMVPNTNIPHSIIEYHHGSTKK